MKNLILGISTLIIAASASAHMIVGTPLKEETYKTTTNVNSVASDCKIKISKIYNVKEEDSYGNPFYKAWVKVDLSGNDVERKIKVKFKRGYNLTNLFVVGTNQTEVRDYEYSAPEGLTLKMRTNGTVERISFPYGNQTVTCSF